jgi:hypothetical protein
MFDSSLIVRAARPRDADTEVKPSVCDPTERGAPTPRPSGGLPATGHGGELNAHWQPSPAGRLVASWSLVVVGDAGQDPDDAMGTHQGGVLQVRALGQRGFQWRLRRGQPTGGAEPGSVESAAR